MTTPSSNDPGSAPLQALPDGDAEVRLVLRLQWEDVAALGQEAGRLAARLQRPVTLDEAASHRLRTRPPAAHAKPALQERPPQGVGPAPVSSLPGGSPGDQARQAIERINGNISSPSGGTSQR